MIASLYEVTVVGVLSVIGIAVLTYKIWKADRRSSMKKEGTK